MFCPNCGTQVSDDSVFCPGCGSRFEAAAAPQPVQYQQPVPTPGYAPALVRVRPAKAPRAGGALSLGGTDQPALTKLLLLLALGLLLVSFLMSMLNVFTVHSMEFEVQTYNSNGYSSGSAYGSDSSALFGGSSSGTQKQSMTMEEINSMASRSIGFNPHLHIDFCMQEAGGTWLMLLTGLLHLAAIVLLILALTGTVSEIGYLLAGCAAGLNLILLVIKWIAGGYGGVSRSVLNQYLKILDKAGASNSEMKMIRQVMDSIKVHLSLTFAGWVMFIALILITAASLILFLTKRGKPAPVQTPAY